MSIIVSLAIIILAAFVHASFQLSVSVLTLLSSQTIGTKQSHSKLLRLTTSFMFGVGLMTLLILSFVSLILLNIFGAETPQIVWAITCGILAGMALTIWLFYYRRHEKGTSLWIPRGLANYLSDRTKATKLSAEAFGLGISSVVGEIFFIIAPILVSALVLIKLPSNWQLIGIGLYTLISLLSLLVVWVLISGGHSLSHIQKWRETNKYFLQFSAGAGLIILGFFVYTNEIVMTVVSRL